nr:extensin-like [Penaeus vannamei]
MKKVTQQVAFTSRLLTTSGVPGLPKWSQASPSGLGPLSGRQTLQVVQQTFQVVQASSKVVPSASPSGPAFGSHSQSVPGLTKWSQASPSGPRPPQVVRLPSFPKWSQASPSGPLPPRVPPPQVVQQVRPSGQAHQVGPKSRGPRPLSVPDLSSVPGLSKWSQAQPQSGPRPPKWSQASKWSTVVSPSGPKWSSLPPQVVPGSSTEWSQASKCLHKGPDPPKVVQPPRVVQAPQASPSGPRPPQVVPDLPKWSASQVVLYQASPSGPRSTSGLLHKWSQASKVVPDLRQVVPGLRSGPEPPKWSRPPLVPPQLVPGLPKWSRPPKWSQASPSGPRPRQVVPGLPPVVARRSPRGPRPPQVAQTSQPVPRPLGASQVVPGLPKWSKVVPKWSSLPSGPRLPKWSEASPTGRRPPSGPTASKSSDLPKCPLQVVQLPKDTWCIIPRWNPWYTELHILPNQLREDYSLVSPETNVFEIELNREGEIEQSYMYKAFGSFRFVSDLYTMRDILKS